jgi:hypothetical protein
VLVSLYRLTAELPVASRQRESSSEHVMFVVPHIDDATPRAPSVDHSAPSAPARAPRSVREAPRDTGWVRRRASALAIEPRASSPASALSIDATSRLAPPGPDRSDRWVAPHIVRAPFAEPAPLSRVERDSVLSALSTMTPEAAAHRAPTRGEVDSAAKEATLKMRLAGRPLLVPPDNSGGLVTLRIPFPGGSSRAKRARVRRADDEGQARLRRLRARADSLLRARADSLERSATVP